MHPASATRIPRENEDSRISFKIWTGNRVVTRYRVERTNIIHCAQAKNDFLLQRDAPPDETSVAALGYYANTASSTELDNVTNLLCCAWTQDGICLSVVFPHPVYIVRSEVVG